MSADTRTKLSTTTIILHWITGIGIIFMMAFGIYMSQNELFDLYPIHKAVGVALFALILLRLFWRMRQGFFLQHVGNYHKWETILSRIILLVLLIGMVLFPISGIVMANASGVAATIGQGIHKALLPIMALAIIIHIVGAYKHHLIDKDGTMRRMLGRRINDTGAL
ncbi:cytochrome b/b6 domain-containing protein [Cardiobacteriaceae bacterium TAE3-ERU3]|nr:cytochrome b/b6 domain-containing protein [Cardiobacteriaceae bacterium TAE3-ERU3]